MKVAVVGATGAVGREMLKILHERSFPADQIVALASESSLGKQVSFGNEKILAVQSLQRYNFQGTDIALFSAGGQRAREFAPQAAAAGCYVIDNSSFFRQKEAIPLVVPEVNGSEIETFCGRIISNPNCVAIPVVMVLKALSSMGPIKRVVISTYQSVSGKGRRAMDELFRQTRSIMVGEGLNVQEFPKQIAFNLLPHIDDFCDDGMTLEEKKIINESCKILGLPVKMSVTCVRVPVFIGHSFSMSVSFTQEASVKNAYTALKKMPNLTVARSDQYTTPIDCVGEDDVFVSRLRMDPSVQHGLNLWVVSDNLRKGAALNAVQIAEQLLKRLNPASIKNP